MVWTRLGRVGLALGCMACIASCYPGYGQTATRATAVPLMLPGALAYDAAGNLYFAEMANHVIRRVDPSGILSTIAGTGVQGFGGDGGPATAALLDSPTGLAFAAPASLLIADTHNERVRRIDLQSGVITTVAGTGVRGSAGDGSLATGAQLSLPSAVAIDPAGDVYVACVGDHRVRRIDTAGRITTTAGNGTQGFAGDGGPAVMASLDSVSGLAVDGANNVYLADSHNGRVRRVDAQSGTIVSVGGVHVALPRGVTVDAAGNLYLSETGDQIIYRVDASTGSISPAVGLSTQGFGGDGGAAATALLDTPGALGLGPGGLLTLADTGNGRVRQVDMAGVIHTIAGLGTTVPGTLMLTGPSVAAYGTGEVTATLVTSPATGAVSLLEGAATLAAMPLVNNMATLGTDGLGVGPHRLTAVYPGDTLHGAAESGTMALTVAPASATATPDAVAVVYGQVFPTLTGTLTGVLARDVAAVMAVYSTSARTGSGSGAGTAGVPGVYPITATLTGAAAGNYGLTVAPASVVVGKAGSAAVLSVPAATVAAGAGLGLSVRVSSATSGTPTGTVTLLDGTQPAGTASLVAGGAGFASVSLGLGAHTLTAAYGGDGNFLASTSAPVVENVVAGTTADFVLAATGQTTLTVPAGTAATFSFSVTPVGTPLASPILLAASGLPPGASANFNPAYLPPGNTVQAFLMAVSTPKASLRTLMPMVLTICLLCLPGGRRRRKVLAATMFSVGLSGCGDRINTGTAAAGVTAKTYTITVTGTATDASGVVVSHTAKVTLNLQ